jgi:hypothetical protein
VTKPRGEEFQSKSPRDLPLAGTVSEGIMWWVARFARNNTQRVRTSAAGPFRGPETGERSALHVGSAMLRNRAQQHSDNFGIRLMHREPRRAAELAEADQLLYASET